MSGMHIWGFSHQGLVRGENQDCLMVNDLVCRDEVKLDIDDRNTETYEGEVLCAVADGLGGQKGGALASETVLKQIAASIAEVFKLSDIESAHTYLNKLILDCHSNLLQMAEKDESVMNMGTTIVGVFIRKAFALVFHAGDSRLYCLRNNKIIRLTRDHSLENYFKSITADYEPQRKSGVITNCLGGGKGSVCKPEINKLTFMDGDRLLLCSDGLTDMLDDKTIEAILSGNEELELEGKRLIEQANNNGGVDNITVLLIEKI